ncbi:protein-disulfide reductase DsbD [Marinomonas ostreistagni]|uniref:protein-disulfide reductase DsbD n=1 Tax=Marinomonas ostreistagni TaxID=359209 RepID=UPI00194E83FB|nr:protein-disulfide reductase DsbD [Marinomonas ostreistagni]MBM6549661.1 protein-disulfide reductase DsbD [Marinomonas ostreistagni]
MRALVALFALTLSTLSLAFGLSSPFSSEPEFLPVEQAFQSSVSQDDNGQVWVSWDIADGYYLYRHQLKVSAVDTDIEFAHIPPGKTKHDQYFGDVEVYYDSLRLPVQIPAQELPKVVDFTLQYQGCAEQGLCYPPQSVPMSTEFSTLAQDSTSQSSAGQASTPTVNISGAQNVSGILAQASVWQALLAMFGLGLLLSFTPCVLPMVPIVSAIVVGSKSKGWGGFYLSALYVLGMALTYAVIGALAGWFGAQLNLQAALQNPIILGVSSALFVLLALAMFGVFELRLPAKLQTKLDQTASQSQNTKSRVLGVFLAGIFATLVVSPCVSAPLAGVVLYISTSSDPMFGAASLFVMGLGMGIPLLLVGALGSKVLPKNGPWLEDMKKLMGFGLLALAIWLAIRWISGPYTLYLWGAWLIALGAYFLHRAVTGLSHPVRWFIAVVTLVVGSTQFVGGLAGNYNPLKPLQGLGSNNSASEHSEQVPYYATITSSQELDSILAQSNRPVVVDLYADWCISCKVTEEEVFKAPDVLPLLEQVTFVQVDVTNNDEANQAFLNQYQLFGPPAMLFFDAQAEQIHDYNLVGEPTKQEVLERLQAVLKQPNQ